jgi:hypothetical protein
MHGIIFAELQKYVGARYGAGTWTSLLEQAGLGKWKMYVPIQEYPDREAVALVTAAATLTGKPAPSILEDFGEFIVPDLLAMYGSLVRPGWKTLDLVENTEQVIHSVVRIRNPGARPPELRAARPSEREVVVTYASARKMCGVAKGIIKGIAGHYNERVFVGETSCMLRGQPSCTISVKLVG